MRWKCENKCLEAKAEVTLSSRNNQKTHFGHKQTSRWGDRLPVMDLWNELKEVSHICFDVCTCARVCECVRVCVCARDHDIISAVSNQGEREPAFAREL